MGSDTEDNPVPDLFPFSYYWREAQEQPPDAIESFVEQNSALITVTGVFAGIVVYLSNLSPTPSNQTVVFGMTGAATFSMVTLLTLMNNTLIEVCRAYHHSRLIRGISYSTLLFSIIAIGVSLGWTLISFRVSAISSWDTLAALVMIVVFPFILKNRYTPPFTTNNKNENENSSSSSFFDRVLKTVFQIYTILLLIIFATEEFVIEEGIVSRYLDLISMESNFISIVIGIGIILIPPIVISLGLVFIYKIYLLLKKWLIPLLNI